ncbi:MAG: Bax inhibitor-1/YccA family protein [Mucispirillum sp.]|nr:Bax inhibitor-1/YccA family protein [Mucispirillum sp.]
MSSPVFSEKILDNYSYNEDGMTVNGSIGKYLLLNVILFVSAIASIVLFTGVDPLSSDVYGNQEMMKGFDRLSVLVVPIIAAVTVGLVIVFKPSLSPFLSIIYAIVEGIVLGVISAMSAYETKGIVENALFATFTVLFVMLFLYRFRIIKATQRFKSVVIGATASISVFYIIMLGVSFFGIYPDWFYGSGNISIGISAAVIIVAALNLILDFDFIEKGAEKHLPKYMEWYAAFGLMITIIWLYLEILRLLSKLNKR